jgi:RNA polymerase sigma-70 factor (ECF subfamily)
VLSAKKVTSSGQAQERSSGTKVAGDKEQTTADEAMVRYSQGDLSAFDIVYEAVAPRIEDFLRRRVRDKARAEDIVQQTFLNIHGARGTFVPGSDLMCWAFRIARNLLIDSSRKARRESAREIVEENDTLAAALASAIAGGEEIVVARETWAQLVRAFEQLPNAQRDVFELVRLEGLSYEQAAAALGITLDSLRMYAHRATVALRRTVAETSPPGRP